MHSTPPCFCAVSHGGPGHSPGEHALPRLLRWGALVVVELTLMSAPLVLALDQGGHGSRAIVFDDAGRSIARAQHEVGESRPAEDRVEQDPEEIVRSLRRAAKDALKFLGKRGSELVAAGLATQRSSVVAWDK